MWRPLLVALMGLALLSPGRAAELDGVTLPDWQYVGSTRLLLNGIGLRTYSIFRIPIYVAGLYLVHLESDPDKILHSTDMKLLDIRFVHDVSPEMSRSAWREGFEQNCVAPCPLRPEDVERFLAAVPAQYKGDHYTILFTPAGAEFTVNGHPLASIADPVFAEEILATFIGPQPPTARLKRELLGSHFATSSQ